MTKLLPDMEHAQKKQYDMLRKEVESRMSAQQNISTFYITSIMAFFAALASFEVTLPYVFIIPILFTLPFVYKEREHKITIAYLVGYMIVALEDSQNPTGAYTWETDHYRYRRVKVHKNFGPRSEKIADSEFILVSLVSLILFGVFFWREMWDKETLVCPINGVGVAIGVILIVLIWLIGIATWGYEYYGNEKERYIQEWLDYLLQEKRIDQETYDARREYLLGTPKAGE